LLGSAGLWRCHGRHLLIGNAHKLSSSPDYARNSIASALANEFTEAVGDLYGSR